MGPPSRLNKVLSIPALTPPKGVWSSASKAIRAELDKNKSLPTIALLPITRKLVIGPSVSRTIGAYRDVERISPVMTARVAARIVTC